MSTAGGSEPPQSVSKVDRHPSLIPASAAPSLCIVQQPAAAGLQSNKTGSSDFSPTQALPM
jgi:hypothetical protein